MERKWKLLLRVLGLGLWSLLSRQNMGCGDLILILTNAIKGDYSLFCRKSQSFARILRGVYRIWGRLTDSQNHRHASGVR